MDPLPTYSVKPFTALADVVRDACLARTDWTPPRQVSYLASYLRGVPARPAQTLIVEHPYVDRHYLEEYTAYYATALRPPSSKATRLHVLSSNLAPDALSQLVGRAAAGGLQEVRHELQESYLGCITVRPIPSAPIGRTLLVHYGETGDREYGPAIRGCVVRLMGIELKIDALPFEQQDQGVGACASAAMWSALAKAARDAGMRTPTPYAVTAAATKNWLTDRALPAVSGLELG
jgi:hypothetical protein